MFEVIRRLCDDAYRVQDSGMSVGLPRVKVDASQLKQLLANFDALNEALEVAQVFLNERVELEKENRRLRAAWELMDRENRYKMDDWVLLAKAKELKAEIEGDGEGE